MAEQKKYIVSIGCGQRQIPLIEAGLSLGYQIIGVDQNAMAPGMDICQIKINESITEYRRIFHKINSLPILGKIEIVASRSYGKAGRTVAYLANKLGLKGNPWQDFHRFYDKQIMRQHLENAGIPITPGFSTEKIKKLPNIKEMPLPWIIKNRTSHGKAGNFLYENKQDIVDFFRQGRKKNEWLIERYIPYDKEYSILGIVNDKTLYIEEIFEKYTSGPPYFVEWGHHSPALISAVKNRTLIQYAQQSVHAMDIHYGPVIIEAIEYQDNFFIIEVVPEFGGEYLAESLLYSQNTNVFTKTLHTLATDNSSQNKKSLFAKQRKHQFWQKNKPHIYIQFLTWQPKEKIIPSRLRQIRLPPKNPHLVYQELFVQPGDTIQPAQNNHQRLGVFIFRIDENQKKNMHSDYQAYMNAIQIVTG